MPKENAIPLGTRNILTILTLFFAAGYFGISLVESSLLIPIKGIVAAAGGAVFFTLVSICGIRTSIRHGLD